MECTATVYDVELDVTFDITPYKPAKLWGDDALPEEGGEIDIEYVYLEGVDVTKLFSGEVIEMIEEQCYAYAESKADDDAADFLADQAYWREAA